MHKLTPWTLEVRDDGDRVIRSADPARPSVHWDTAYYPSGLDPEDEAFIIKAVNAHDELVTALKRCSELFSEIRNDWSDPRSECREGWAVIAAALAKAGVE